MVGVGVEVGIEVEAGVVVGVQVEAVVGVEVGVEVEVGVGVGVVVEVEVVVGVGAVVEVVVDGRQAMKFQKATKKQARARIALMGPGGSGKTWSALELASGLGQRIAVIDSERGSASKYSDRFSFDVLELETFGPEKYIEAINAAQSEGYDVVIIDSLSHAWTGKDGVLERVDKKGGMTGGGWRDVTPLQNRLTDAILTCKAHVIVTMRVKTAYEMEKNDKGKIVPRKVGLAPVQKDGFEYEFDVVASLDGDNNLSVEKTRCAALHGRVWTRQNPEIASILKEWLTDGAPLPTTSLSTPAPTAAPSTPVSTPAVSVAPPARANSTPTAAAAPASDAPGVALAKTAFPGAVAVDAEREEVLMEARRIIAQDLEWTSARAREEIASLFAGAKKTTKELDRAEATRLRDHLASVATALKANGADAS